MADSYANAFERLVNRAFAEEIGDSVFKATILHDRMWKKRKAKTGTRVEVPIYTNTTGTATMFAPTAMGATGSTGAVTFAEPSRLVNLQLNYTGLGDTLRMDEMRLKQSEGNEAKFNYMKEQSQLLKKSMEVLAGTQMINGNPLNSSTDIYGLTHLFQTVSASAITTYGGVDRSQSDALYPALYDARSTTSTAYTSGSLSVTISSNIITATLTSISTWSTNVYVGDRLTISGDTTTYTVRAVVSDTVLHVTPKVTRATTTTATYTISHAFGDGSYGNSQVITLEKIDRAYADACDGNEEPTIMLSDNFTKQKVMSLMIANQRYTGETVNTVGTKKFRSFNYAGAEYFVDNYCAAGTITGLNEPLCDYYTLKGMDSITLAPGALQRDYSSFARASYVAQVNLGLIGVACRAPNRQFQISGFQS
jgi:hypothetical protein